MFDRSHHRRVADLLENLDAARLSATHCYFGGGTAIALIYGELRLSTDVDFLVSDRHHYRDLREQITEDGLGSLFRNQVSILRGPVADQYGIRALLGDTDPIKFEIIREGLIDLDVPTADERVFGIKRLTSHDLVASKLLANDDRWADRALYSRDIIDLAIIAPDTAVWDIGLRKARDAYGKTVQAKLIRAIDAAVDQPGWLDECVEALQIRGITADDLHGRIEYIRRLAVDTK